MANKSELIINDAIQSKRFVLTEVEAKDILREYGLPIPQQKLAANKDEIEEATHNIEFPIVMKIVSPDISHKTDAGGVKVNVKTIEEAKQAYSEIQTNARNYKPDADIWGVLVQEMEQPGQEIIVGMKRDPIFGPLILLGLGGIWVELLKDVAIRVLPIMRQDVYSMLEEIKGSRLLQGFRGRPVADVEALVDIVMGVVAIVEQYPQIAELDLNPVFVREKGEGATIVDARIILNESVAPPSLATPQLTAETAKALFNPDSIAVIGASSEERKNGGRLMKYILKHGYPGKLFPINPNERVIRGYPCYANIKDVPEPVELACIIVPAKAVATVVKDCIEKGVKVAIVYSSGFSETGEEGRRLQQEIVQIARAGGLRLVGPNTVGIVNPMVKTYTAFGMALEADNPLLGNIAFVTQSGALGGALVSRAWEQNIGFSRWIASGNEADLNTADFIKLLAVDDQTKAIGMFMEGIKNGETFKEAAIMATEAGKPIILYKTGRSELGNAAVQSHTGSLAGDDKAYDAMFKQYGVIRVSAVWDVLDAASAFASLPLPKGNRVGIVSTSGGACSMLADECSEAGLDVVKLPEIVEAVIRQYIPTFGSYKNPVDITAEVLSKPEIFKKVLEILVAEQHIDAVIIMLTTSADPVASKVAQAIIEIAQSCKKPLLITRMGAEFLAPQALPLLIKHNMPVYPTPDRVVKVLKAMVQYSKFLSSRQQDI